MSVEAAPLSPNEARALAALSKGAEHTVDALADSSGLAVAQVRSAIEGLTARSLAELVREETARRVVATELGRQFAEIGTPELAILGRLDDGPISVKDCQNVPEHDKKAVGTAFGFLKKNGFIEVDKGQATPGSANRQDLEADLATLREIAAAGDAGTSWDALPEGFRERYQPRKRGGGSGTVEIQENTTRWYEATAEGRTRGADAAATADAPAALTSDMLRTGAWKDVLGSTGFRPYTIGEAPEPVVGRRDAYREFLDVVKQKLLALGFEEMMGSLVETEFWDMDALFLPQFHPAREIHDVYFIDDGEGGLASQHKIADTETASIRAVASEHEGGGKSASRGWGYEFDHERTHRLVLRSQGTVLSARWLARPDLQIPGKYFAMARCFRYDTVDATHAPDFFQVEGIVASEQTSFRHLLGLLKLFAVEIAKAKEVKFVPAYFPFTEPSVEMHVKHPDLGWIELGGAGIFRPEVTLPHGVDVPVIAWGLGLDRMAMIALGIKDIRELFTNNIPNGLQSVRERGAV